MENQSIQKVETFGDVRMLILQTVLSLRDGKMDVSTGMVIAANLKVLNDNINTEINAAKLSLQTEAKAHQFGNVVKMGRRLISDNSNLN